MKKIKLFQVDAFTDKLFRGNPAAVCPLQQWLPDDVLQHIATENNLSETAFFKKASNGRYDLRWFTPVNEVDLCGHATLATAFVIFQFFNHTSRLCFNSQSGPLAVEKEKDTFYLDFPVREAKPVDFPESLVKGLGVKPRELYLNRDYYAVYESESVIRTIHPDFERLTQLDAVGVCITAPGSRVDFVSRFFAPKEGIPEDPVTGSAHTTLIPFWADRLQKRSLNALQLSHRGGELQCQLKQDRVKIGGKAVLYLRGEITL